MRRRRDSEQDKSLDPLGNEMAGVNAEQNPNAGGIGVVGPAAVEAVKFEHADDDQCESDDSEQSEAQTEGRARLLEGFAFRPNGRDQTEAEKNGADDSGPVDGGTKPAGGQWGERVFR